MGVTELASRLKLSTTSVHRMLTTLVALGWAEQNTRTLSYGLGTRLLGVGAAGLITHPIVQRGKHFIQRLSELTGFDAYLSTLVGGRVVYLARTPGERGFGSEFEAGVSMPAHALADGKLLLAYATPAERELLHKGGLQSYTPQTVTDSAALKLELACIRAQGYSIDRGERFSNVRAMAVPIMGAEEKPILGMTCVASKEVMPLTEDYVAWLSQAMRSLALEMADQLMVLGDMPKVYLEMARYNRSSELRGLNVQSDDLFR
jgi:DNA-binding IclR family transcriptional regulator